MLVVPLYFVLYLVEFTKDFYGDGGGKFHSILITLVAVLVWVSEYLFLQNLIY